RLKMKLIRRENQFMIKGSGWTAGAKQIAARLHQWRSLHLVAEWSSLTSTGRAAPYLSSSHLMKDLLFSHPSLVSLRCHLLPCGANRRQGRRQCTLCGELESQTHILGGCPSRMSMFTLRHNEIRSKLSKFLRDNLHSCSIVEERALESSESSTSSSRPDISIPEKNITLDVSNGKQTGKIPELYPSCDWALWFYHA
ncbi:hypothetical protein ADUPG1_001612, partial [Aduncisulcus paluster]